jgi:hypothetical protein
MLYIIYTTFTLYRNGPALGAVVVEQGLVDDRHLLSAMNVLACDEREIIFNLLGIA